MPDGSPLQSALPAKLFVQRGNLPSAILVIAIAMVCAGRVGMLLANTYGGASPFWPSVGVAAAALVIRGWGIWPGILIGALLAHYLNGSDPAVAIPYAIISTLSSLAGYRVFLWLRGRGLLAGIRDVLAWLIGFCLVGPLASAFFGTAVMVADDVVPPAHVALPFATWMIGDAVGVLVVGTLLLVIAFYRRPGDAERLSWVELGSMVGLIGISSLTVFANLLPHLSFIDADRPYLVLPGLIWPAVRRGMVGAASASAAVATVAITGTAMGYGPFGVAGVLHLQVFLLIMVATVFITASLTAERARIHRRAKLIERLSWQTISVLPQAVLVANRDGIIVEANEAAAKLVGVKREEIVGQHFKDSKFLLWREDDTPLKPEDHPGQTALRTKTEVRNMVLRAHNSRKEAWVEVSAIPVLEENDVVAVIMVARDISEERWLKAANDAKMNRLHEVADNIPAFVYVTDTDGQNIFENKTWRDFVGKGREFGNGAGWINLVHPDERERVLAAEDAAFARRQRYEERYRLLDNSGDWVWVLDIGVPNYDAAGRFIGYIGILVNIDNDQRIKSKMESLANIGTAWRMAGAAAMDIAASLSVVMASLENASGGRRKDDKGIMTALKAAERAATAATRIMSAERARDDRAIAIDVSQSLAAAIEAVKPVLGQNWDIRADIKECWALSGPGAIEAMALSLFLNAKDAMPIGGSIDVVVRHMTAREAGGMTSSTGDWVAIEVIDQGHGIREDDIPFVTKPFWTRKEGAAGLGLAMVEREARAVGGAVQIDSRAGRGTTVRILLPTADESDVQAIGNHGPLPSGNGELIALAVSDEGLQLALVEQLRSLSYRTVVAETVKDAVEQRPRVLLVDSVDTRTAHDPAIGLFKAKGGSIVFLTGLNRRELEDHEIIEANDAVLHLPYMKRDLAMTLRETMARLSAQAWAG